MNPSHVADRLVDVYVAELDHELIEMSVPSELNRTPALFDKRNMLRLGKKLGGCV